MTLDAERLLLPALLAFYLKDCIRLLHPDEGVLERRDARRWSVRFGSRLYTLRGLEPLLLNPFTPHRPAWRLRWSMTAPQADTAWRCETPPALRRLAPWAVAIALMLFVAAPVALYGRLGFWVVIGAVASVYAGILAMLVATWRTRSTLGLDRAAFAVLAAEALLCPPYAVNLVRKVAWRLKLPGDLVATARQLLPPPAYAAVRRECAARIADQLEVVDEASARHAQLKRMHEVLTAGGEESVA